MRLSIRMGVTCEGLAAGMSNGICNFVDTSNLSAQGFVCAAKFTCFTAVFAPVGVDLVWVCNCACLHGFHG